MAQFYTLPVEVFKEVIDHLINHRPVRAVKAIYSWGRGNRRAYLGIKACKEITDAIKDGDYRFALGTPPVDVIINPHVHIVVESGVATIVRCAPGIEVEIEDRDHR